MSRISKKFVKFGTGSDEVNARDVPANFTATNYTPTQVASEGSDKISAHLNGIDTALGTVLPGTGDIPQSTFTAADNQASPANITGLAFANGSVRGFKVLLSVTRDTTYAIFEFLGIQKNGSWEMSQEKTGDDTGLSFTITTAGQIQYVSSSTGNTATVNFRAQALQV